LFILFEIVFGFFIAFQCLLVVDGLSVVISKPNPGSPTLIIVLKHLFIIVEGALVLADFDVQFSPKAIALLELVIVLDSLVDCLDGFADIVDFVVGHRE
jgi:hypothetical protein